ncbi:MAG: Gfo/Idh/MocA family oxidoreductase [Kiritimatiellaeota bacterium]|nr:Gfo/Idh/MocA family oxidoreductase [Kiritimatiellota bacterium]
MAEKVRTSIIGLGWPGKEHLKGYLACPTAEVTALCDWDEPLLQAVADEYGIERRYTDYREMIASEEIDAVSVCVPNYEHAELSIDALCAGKHVLCEKPPAMNADQARAMAAAATQSDRVLMYALVMRFRPEVQFVRRLVDAGEFGEIYIGKAGYTRRRGIPRGKDNWFIDRKRSGGGALIDIGVHALDCVWYMMGTPKPVQVLGSTYSKFGHTVPNGITYDVDDAALALIGFENGASLYLEATWAWNLPGGPMKQIAGTKGGADLEPFRLFSERDGVLLDTATGAGGMPEGYGSLPKNPFFGETAHFVSVIQGKAQPIATAEHGVQLMEMLDAVYRAGETGRSVEI